MKNIKLNIVLNRLSPDQRIAFAEKAGTTVGYLYQIEGGHSLPSPQLAVKIERASIYFGFDLTRQDLRPDSELIWGAA